ncbi:TPA: SDR family NAD(P)-dependent oxidoreductase [Legionella pneumophila subsp. pneumophila]|uniref:SDR family NAD(P)-dependent oxidoreductase n=1 Tax=Legionella pneumophila TaxID=446 RepID=UPI0007709037|nr:SDR family NAD(P)-dependent oxidoreductase [Legionella pneumophila]HAT9214188.1 SDR family NAD(P)-dependent oxidoreductase [Legionella pneumophila subsp. pneumophila]CZI64824.1 Polyketide synthase PksJ [Legionella pneumophila]HAT9261728.1 SDR family NAD(P)-dependent oxidoreductase [Legionella pneumophila subsp. pneumophila]HAT9283087.1 SDR family NAD(P)-dependent oxidoreductase [Legionella pneumophila subsp. pneumophila]HAT9288632.1 SDR family NAD(P)-dependent oxidoreductase [Legionella pne
MVNVTMKNKTKDLLNEPIAIIGMNCQFPGIDSDIEDVSAFYDMLMKGQTPIKDVPENRWNIEEYYSADRKKADKIISKKGGFLDNTHLFDAAYFKISSAEAKQIDPQQRLFLEVAIRALNDANIPLDSLKDSNSGVYCGISTHEYSQLNYKDHIKFNAYTPIGIANSAAAGRLCHFLNLKGPSMAVDTACSSSFTALYLAATALRNQQCDMAIVGGVHLSLCPESFIGLTKANMLSATGQCSSFDSKADGFVRSEGCGVVIVKRLSDAIRDNNKIYALIKSMVINQNGDGTGLAAPSTNAQIAMHQAALEHAHLTAGEIDYIETHGTGTTVGDPVEFNAIQSIHQGHHSAQKPLIVGALKSNIGHTISSSGIASLIKVLCSLQNEAIPPNLHYSNPNNLIDPESIPALLPVEAIPFPKLKNKKRYIQVSNFSFTGTNVSVILEEAPELESHESKQDNNEPKCFVASANSELSLKELMSRYEHYLKNSSSTLGDICHTLINCRDHYKFRCAIIVNDKKELIKKIESKDYEIRKVVLQNNPRTVLNDAKAIYEAYLSGINIITDDENTAYNKVDLPLYCFDRKPYWHEVRKQVKNDHWLDSLYQQPMAQQVDAIKAELASQIKDLLKKDSIDPHQDLETLGLTTSLLESLDQILQDMFSPRYKVPSLQSLRYLTLDKLARHLQKMIMPPVVYRQPSINVLNVEPIAIIGMSCRFPKAANVDEFLSLLEKGESGMIDIPLERWDNEKFYDSDVDALGKLYIKQLGFIDHVNHFDAEFFNISPREAKLMSPQLRVFMETSYHALEDANLSLDAVKDTNTGVFVGVGTNEYPRVLAYQGVTLEDLNIYFATGNVLNALAGRVAYSFDFHGPIQAIDTACSSSMTAIHNACLSLQSGDCNMALAGGVNIILSPDSNITLSKARMLSPDSRCKTFSEDADGYGRSEGCGVVVLKRLSDAVKDNDNILAVIKGTSINSDGKSGGFTVPNGAAQEEVILSALAKANLTPGDIDFVEAHGTGTPLADPIEVNTLTKIFSEHHNKENPLYISSVKTNIGHSESASGVASVIKTVLSLKTKTIFKHLNFKKLNPAIQLINTVIPLDKTDWAKKQGLRCAGVSSFGFSGANAHAIIQEAPEDKKEARALPEESLLVLSAKSKTSLELLLASYQNYLSNTREEFADICYTAATCRTHFMYRVAIRAQNATQAANIIKNNGYTICHITKEKEWAQQPDTLAELQTAYLDGFLINWSEFYRSFGHHFAKVKLPLYEFERIEHWFGDKNKLKDAPLPKDWCFQIQWQNEPCDKSNRKLRGNRWLLIGPRHLADGFKAQGLEITYEDEEYSRDKLEGIIFAESLHLAPPDIEANIDFQKKTLKKLLNLIKELDNQSIDLQLLILTSNGIAELANDKHPVNISNSPLIGFCKTLALELPQFKTILIDMDKIEEDKYPTQVIEEINYNHGSRYEHIVAYRGGERLASRLKKTPLEDRRRLLHGVKGRYLITGGCGGLGLVTAQSLLSSGARELILTSRNIDKPRIKEAIYKIKSHYPGANIRVVSLDITDRESLKNLLSELNTDGQLKGIIHAAGAAIKAPLLEHQDEDVDYLFSAKVKGGWYLHELSLDCNLDFFVVYSSVSSVFGSNKESVYSGTNSFLDALIAERQRMGLPGTAVQWGPWGEVGMAQKRSRDEGLKQALISNAQGHVIIKCLINDEFKHATIISPEYLKFMLDFVPKPLPGFYGQLDEELEKIPQQHHQSPAKNLSPWLNQYLEISEEERFKACKAMVSDICTGILELTENEDLNEDEGFFELGFDSLMITELASELKKKLEPFLKVTVTIGFNYPSISKLAKYIESELDKNLVKIQSPKSALKPIDDGIAIIGMSCLLPNAPDIAAFEKLLEEGLSGIKDIPNDRWDNSQYYDPDMEAPGKSYVTKLGLIENIKYFDAAFFGISPREAKLMEPQQRVFLECCYKALENANYPSESLRGSLTGVFAGVGPNEYYAQLEKSGFSNEELSAYSITGNVLNLIPGRVAYTFDFKGPSISVDTACSSSLVAIHYACQSLKNKEIDYALAGGVNILLMPESNVTLCKAKALSPDGQCKTFDEKADGYVRGEGCGVILLKRLSDALRDNDHILAVIKGSAVNNDGKTAGLTVPNGKSQEEVMKKALGQTELSRTDISYIEAHGTGTPLGDPIEVDAINKVYGHQRNKENPLYLGTVKTNIGHLESASGVAGVIKTVISLQRKTIYKNLNFNKLNPNIKLDGTQLALEKTNWNTNTKLNYAAVNAFGFSGTNAHVILAEFPKEEKPKTSKPPQKHLLVISAHSKTALDNLTQRYQQYLETTEHHFGDICFTAATCREHYHYRLALTAENAVEASRMLGTGQFALSYHENITLDLQNDRALNSLLMDYLQGKPVDWKSYYQSLKGEFTKVLLPNYTFDRSEYWLDKKNKDSMATHKGEQHPLLGQMLAMPGNEYLFHQKLDLENLAYIKQHSVFEKVIFPATAYIESGLAAAKSIFQSSAFQIEKFNIERPLHPKQGQEFQLQVKPKMDGQYKINLFAKQENDWQTFCEMEIHAKPTAARESIHIDVLKSSFGDKVELSDIYEQFQKSSLFYGDEFRVLQEGYVRANSVLAKVTLTKASQDQDYYYHPVLLDGAMQSILLLSVKNDDNKNFNAENVTYIPYAFIRMTVFQEAPRSLWVHLTKQNTEDASDLCVNMNLYEQSGLLIAQIAGLKLRRVTRSHFVSYDAALNHLYYTEWSPIPLKTIPQQKIPDFLAITKNPGKAKEILDGLNYHLVERIDDCTNIENSNVVFLYEQGQFHDLFHCCQILFRLRPKRFILVTEHAYAIQDHDQVNPYHTMAYSFWKSFRNEYEPNKNYAIDLDSRSRLATALMYLLNTDTHDTQIAVRESLYLPRLKKKQLVSNSAPERLIDGNATYLITGGTGGLAKPLMEYLMRRGARHIAITSRAHYQDDIKALIDKAKQNQIDIKHYMVDAGNYQKMEQVIGEIQQSPNRLKGVFHLAGLIQDGLIVNLNDEAMQKVISAKMDGALILHQLTQNIPLEWFVMFSSSASLLGARGQANYAAANGFLDGLAHLRRQQGLPAISINWGPFHTTGMAANLTHTLQHYGFLPLDKDNIDILDVLLPIQLPQISPCPMNWDVYCKHTPKQTELSALVKAKPLPDQSFLNALRQHSKEEGISILSQALREIAADVLALDDSEHISNHHDLFSMGLDSLMSMDIRNRIYDKLQCQTLSLPIEYFINTPTINKIARHISDELDHVFDSHSDYHPTENPSEREIALCDFQYVFWVLNKLDYHFNIGTQIQLHGRINKDYVQRAFEFVVNQNSVFWIHFNKDKPTQKLHKVGQFELIYQDISLNHETKALNHEFQNNILRAIPLTKQPLIRVYLYRINNDLHELHIVIPHIIVDDASCEMVFCQFKNNYEKLILGKELVSTPEKGSYFNYVKQNNNHYQKNLKNKIDFWQNYNKGLKMLSFGNRYHLSDTSKQTKHLFHYPIDPQHAEQFINWHKAQNINVSTGLIAACQIVFYKLSRQNKIPIILIHSGREGGEYKSTLGLFSEYKRINLTLNENGQFIDCIHSIEEQLLKTAPYQKCSHLIKDSGLKGSSLSFGQYLTLALNKMFMLKHFKESKLHSIIIDYYLKYLSRLLSFKKNISMKQRLNQLFKLDMSLQKPERLRVLVSVTPSFFTKERPDMSFANLDYSYPNHFGCMDRPIGNRTLWIYFSKNQDGEYQISINAPLTIECKNKIGSGLSQFITTFVENNNCNIAELIQAMEDSSIAS